jgi:acyl-CoA reductase-like NAD-dependent aldehyde dehydrogenase
MTAEWIEVRSPYSGDVVGRVAKSGADAAQDAIDSAATALANPLPAHERAAVLDRVANAL